MAGRSGTCIWRRGLCVCDSPFLKTPITPHLSPCPLTLNQCSTMDWCCVSRSGSLCVFIAVFILYKRNAYAVYKQQEVHSFITLCLETLRVCTGRSWTLLSFLFLVLMLLPTHGLQPSSSTIINVSLRFWMRNCSTMVTDYGRCKTTFGSLLIQGLQNAFDVLPKIHGVFFYFPVRLH